MQPVYDEMLKRLGTPVEIRRSPDKERTGAMGIMGPLPVIPGRVTYALWGCKCVYEWPIGRFEEMSKTCDEHSRK